MLRSLRMSQRVRAGAGAGASEGPRALSSPGVLQRQSLSQGLGGSGRELLHPRHKVMQITQGDPA